MNGRWTKFLLWIIFKIQSPVAPVYITTIEDMDTLNDDLESGQNFKDLKKMPTIEDLILHTAGFSYNFFDNKVALEYSQKKLFYSSNTTLEEEIEISKSVVKSPIVGTAYLAPEPGAKPFVSVGKKIKKGETIMIVEAMKTMNHVPSTSDGEVKKILVEDGQPVEFGQTLVILK